MQSTTLIPCTYLEIYIHYRHWLLKHKSRVHAVAETCLHFFFQIQNLVGRGLYNEFPLSASLPNPPRDTAPLVQNVTGPYSTTTGTCWL
jgi:hypothetical protein